MFLFKAFLGSFTCDVISSIDCYLMLQQSIFKFTLMTKSSQNLFQCLAHNELFTSKAFQKLSFLKLRNNFEVYLIFLTKIFCQTKNEFQNIKINHVTQHTNDPTAPRHIKIFSLSLNATVSCTKVFKWYQGFHYHYSRSCLKYCHLSCKAVESGRRAHSRWDADDLRTAR